MNKVTKYSQYLKSKRHIEQYMFNNKFMCSGLKKIYTTAYKKLLKEMNEIGKEAEEEINNIPDEFIRSVMLKHYVDGVSWEFIASQMGYGYTGDTLRLTVKRYISRTQKSAVKP